MPQHVLSQIVATSWAQKPVRVPTTLAVSCGSSLGCTDNGQYAATPPEYEAPALRLPATVTAYSTSDVWDNASFLGVGTGKSLIFT